MATKPADVTQLVMDRLETMTEPMTLCDLYAFIGHPDVKRVRNSIGYLSQTGWLTRIRRGTYITTKLYKQRRRP